MFIQIFTLETTFQHHTKRLWSIALRINVIFKYTQIIRCWSERFWEKTIKRILGFLLSHFPYMPSLETSNGPLRRALHVEKDGYPSLGQSSSFTTSPAACPTPSYRCVKCLSLVIIVKECFCLHSIYFLSQWECFRIPLWNLFSPHCCSLDALPSPWVRSWHQGGPTRCSRSGIGFLRRVTKRLKRVSVILREALEENGIGYCYQDLTDWLGPCLPIPDSPVFPSILRAWALVFQ